MTRRGVTLLELVLALAVLGLLSGALVSMQRLIISDLPNEVAESTWRIVADRSSRLFEEDVRRFDGPLDGTRLEVLDSAVRVAWSGSASVTWTHDAQTSSILRAVHDGDPRVVMTGVTSASFTPVEDETGDLVAVTVTLGGHDGTTATWKVQP